MNNLKFPEWTKARRERVLAFFKAHLTDIPAHELKIAIETACLQNPGKMLRPLLVYATGEIFTQDLASLDVAAAAIESMHTYSLIHDDLPGMDNSDLRRGQPTSHKQFGEATAILVGDGLQTLSFELLSSAGASFSAEQRVNMLQTLAKAAGAHGMVAGQALDMSVTPGMTLTEEMLLTIFQLKTGALFSAAIELGRLASGDDNTKHQRALAEFGLCIGLAFQIQDDLLDKTLPTSSLGKPQGLDVVNQKFTYLSLHREEAVIDKIKKLYEEALSAIDVFGNRAQLLRDLTKTILVSAT